MTDYDMMHLRLMAERDAALSRAERSEAELAELRAMSAARDCNLYWCPHCREVLRGVGVWIMEGKPSPVCSRHIDEADLQLITDEVARAAYAKGSLLMRIVESEREELHVLRSQLGEAQAESERLRAGLLEVLENGWEWWGTAGCEHSFGPDRNDEVRIEQLLKLAKGEP